MRRWASDTSSPFRLLDIIFFLHYSPCSWALFFFLLPSARPGCPLGFSGVGSLWGGAIYERGRDVVRGAYFCTFPPGPSCSVVPFGRTPFRPLFFCRVRFVNKAYLRCAGGVGPEAIRLAGGLPAACTGGRRSWLESTDSQAGGLRFAPPTHHYQKY